MKLVDWSEYWTPRRDGWNRSHFFCQACDRHLFMCCNDAQNGHKGTPCVNPINCMFEKELMS